MFLEVRNCRKLLTAQVSTILSSAYSHVAAAVAPDYLLDAPLQELLGYCSPSHCSWPITRKSGLFLPCLLIRCRCHWQNPIGIQSGKYSFRLLTIVIMGSVLKKGKCRLNASGHSLPPDVLFILPSTRSRHFNFLVSKVL